MAKYLHNIDRLFNEAQEGFEDNPSPASWDKIQAALDHADAEKYKTRFLWWKRVAVAMLVVFCLLITREVLQNPEHKGNSLARQGAAKATDTTGIKSAGNGRPAEIVHRSTYDTFTYTMQNSRSSGTNEHRNSDQGKLNNINVKFREVRPVTRAQSLMRPFAKQNCTLALYGDLVPVKNIWYKSFATQLPLALQIRPLGQTIAVGTGNTKKGQHTTNKHIQFAGIYVSADISQYMMDNDVPEEQRAGENERDEVSQREKHEPSFSAGVFAEKPLSPHAGIKAGITYAKAAIVIAPQQLVAIKLGELVGYKYITSSGYALLQPATAAAAVGDSAYASEAQHRLDVVSVPVSFYYRVVKGRFLISPSAGLSANFITAARVQTELHTGGGKEAVHIDRLVGSRWFYAGAQTEVDIRYRVAGKWQIGITPAVRCAFTAITKNNAVKTFPYTIGVAGSLVYSF